MERAELVTSLRLSDPSCPKKMLVRLFELKSPHNEIYGCIGGIYLREKVIEGMGLKGYSADA
jgi:hypothetical protein